VPETSLARPTSSECMHICMYPARDRDDRVSLFSPSFPIAVEEQIPLTTYPLWYRRNREACEANAREAGRPGVTRQLGDRLLRSPATPVETHRLSVRPSQIWW